MARTKSQKKDIIDKLEKIADDSKSIVFVHFKGLRVNDTVNVRKKLRSEGVDFFVSKKSLTRKALDGKKYTGTMPELVGEVGIAYSKDLIAPARGVYEFQKKFKDNIKILGGVFEGAYMSQVEMLNIATIPPAKTLQAMFVNVINSPIQGFVMALDAIAKKKTA